MSKFLLRLCKKFNNFCNISPVFFAGDIILKKFKRLTNNNGTN